MEASISLGGYDDGVNPVLLSSMLTLVGEVVLLEVTRPLA